MYKRGKATPFLGTFHGSDIPEFYGSSGPNGTAPDFIGTDALGMSLNQVYHYTVLIDTRVRVFSELREHRQPHYSIQL